MVLSTKQRLAETTEKIINDMNAYTDTFHELDMLKLKVKFRDMCVGLGLYKSHEKQFVEDVDYKTLTFILNLCLDEIFVKT